MISVIIPAYNEEKKIKQTIDTIINVILKETNSLEIIVVNDGSQDKTEEAIKNMKNKYVRCYSFSKNQGKGSAVKYGIQKSRGDIVVFMDADLPYSPEKILPACKMIENGADMVLGMRTREKSEKNYSWYRKILSKGFGIFVRSMVHIQQRDSQCGLKLFRKEAAQKIFDKITVTGWSFDVEVIFLAEKLNYKIERIPVALYHEERKTKRKILYDGLKMIGEVLSIRKKYKKGIYNL